jgi:DNA-binding CsgD family transcriptional regulator
MGPSGEGLLERDLERAHLQRAVDHCWHGVGRLVVISGPAGIGKTTLLGTARELATAASFNVLSARGSELEQSFPFGVLRQLFDSFLATADEARRAEWLSGAAELAGPVFDPRAPLHEAGGNTAYPRLHGLYWMCSNLSRRRPLALCIDDAEWVDEPSLAFLEFLAPRLDELPILVVVAVRQAETDAPDGPVALLAQSDARVLNLRGLSADAVQCLLAPDAGGSVAGAFAAACRTATGGNPFLVHELMRELDETGIAPTAASAEQVGTLGPQRVADAVLARLARVSPAAPELARAVAILGDGASVTNAAALAELDESLVIDAVESMRTRELLRDGERLAFAHPIIRASIYQSMLLAERTMRHSQAAELLHQRGAAPEQVAAQVLHADLLAEPWALEELRLAASSAVAMGAPLNSVAYLHRALELDHAPGEHAALLAQLGRAEVLAGLPGASAHLEQAVGLTDDPEEQARIAIMLAQVLKFGGRAERAVELLSALEERLDPSLRERVEAEMLSAALISHKAHELLDDRIARLSDPGGPARSEAEGFRLILLAFERLLDDAPADRVLDLLERGGGELGSADESLVLPPGVMTHGAILTYCEHFDAAAARYEQVIASGRKRGSLSSVLLGLSMRAEIAYRRGALAAALDDARAAVELCAELPGEDSAVLLVHPLGVIANIAVEEGRSDDELEAQLAEIETTLDGDTLRGSLTLVARARLLFALGRPESALEQLLAFESLGRTFGAGTPAIVAWRSTAAIISGQLGDRAGAERLAHDELELARAFGAPRALGIALRAGALVQVPPALDVLQEAVQVLRGSVAQLELARALVDLGAAMRRAGQRAASRSPLREGHDLAVLCGATRLAENARHEIASTGARVAPAGLHGVDSLTPSERRVAELAAEGLTNRDIAQSLFITEKTVETHLGHVYGKLDVRSRHKLAAMLGERPAIPA